MNWAQLLFRHPDDSTVILLRWEGFTQIEPLLMVLYGITLAPLTEELRDADPILLSPFYADDAEFGRSVRQSAAQLRLLMEREEDLGNFPDPSKFLFITDNLEE